MNFKENFDQEIILQPDKESEITEPIEVKLNPDIDKPKESDNSWIIWAILGLIIVGLMIYKNLNDNE